jgi:hypothetical protein
MAINVERCKVKATIPPILKIQNTAGKIIMKKSLTWKIAASLVYLALLTFGSSAFAALTITLTNQNGSAPLLPHGLRLQAA